MELYNLRHSQAWNVVKRIFGVAKTPLPSFGKQMNIPCQPRPKLSQACVSIRNFICTYEPDEVLDPGDPEAMDTSPEDARGVYGTGNIAGQRHAGFKAERGHCKAMWLAYQQELEKMGQV